MKIFIKKKISQKFQNSPKANRLSSFYISKFKTRKNHDRFMKEFYGKTNANLEKYFAPSKDRKIVFLMLIHLPEHLVKFLEESSNGNVQDVVHVSISTEESGPLSYLIGYVIRSLYQKSKKCSPWKSNRNKEIQAMMLSMKIETERNQFIESILRGGL